MEDFATWFCLKNRLNFTIDPQVNYDDARYYFGRDEIKTHLQKQLKYSFISPGVPKMMIWGPYGSGKTQTLFYLKYFLETNPPISLKGVPHILYLTIELRGNSTAANIHIQLMETLSKDVVSKMIRKLFDSTQDFDKALLEISEDTNIYKALKELRATDESSFLAWRWLTGQPLNSKELSGLQITRNLGANGSGDLVSSLVSVGSLANKVGEKLVFLIDEMEQLQNVKTGDATESIHDYLRKLADTTNASVGFLIGFKADTPDEAPDMLGRGDISGRISKSNYVEVPHLEAPPDVKIFLRELLSTLVDNNTVEEKISSQKLNTEPGIFPFERDAFESFADYAAQDPYKALPRLILNAINECAIRSWDEEKQLVDTTIVEYVAPRIFQ